MEIPSRARSPVAPVRLRRSEPAKSTKLNFAVSTSTSFSAVLPSTFHTVNISISIMVRELCIGQFKMHHLLTKLHEGLTASIILNLLRVNFLVVTIYSHQLMRYVAICLPSHAIFHSQRCRGVGLGCMHKCENYKHLKKYYCPILNDRGQHDGIIS